MLCVCEDALLLKFVKNFMAEENKNLDGYHPGYGDRGDLHMYYDDEDQVNDLQGEFAEVGSPKDVEAATKRVNKLVNEIREITGESMPVEAVNQLVLEFVLKERDEAAGVAQRLVEKRNMLPTGGEEVKE